VIFMKLFITILIIPITFQFCTLQNKESDMEIKPNYIIDNELTSDEILSSFNKIYKDSTNKILVIFDAGVSSTQYNYLDLLLSDSVTNEIAKNYIFFAFFIERIDDEGHEIILEINKDYKWPMLVVIDESRNAIEVPSKLYVARKDSWELLKYLEKP
jgi:hypothetical protein